MDQGNVGVCIIVFDKNKKRILLGKRLSGYKAGMLGLPGGRVELGELVEESGKRELFEETSIKAKEIKCLGIIRELQKRGVFIHHVFLCDEFEGELINVEPEKCGGWNWCLINELPKNIIQGHKKAIDIFLNTNSNL